MAKARTAYLCSECGAHSVKWDGQCPDCGAWNTLSETAVAAPRATAGVASTRFDALPDDIESRYATGFGELQTESVRGHLRPDDDSYRGMSPFSDPVYVVTGRKPSA